ncbi:hypothetical protein BVI434_1400008 [Burkholderia vietnamiensis]|nr:hypothetical protein BVI434_1400008 [Burkholderia vietnamiensis]
MCKYRGLDILSFFVGPVAQLVEQRIENPRVDGSIPSQATSSSNPKNRKILGVFRLWWGFAGTAAGPAVFVGT